MRILTLSLITLLTITAIAQNNASKFGLLNPADLDLKSCAFESDAPAVVLFDRGESKFIQDDTHGFILTFTRHTRIKIFEEGGFDQSEIEIYLSIGKGARETVRKIKGYSYNLIDGKLVQTALDPTQIFQEKVNEYWYMKKFAMPKIKKGTIIEFSYTIDSPFYNHFRDWKFQSDIPTMYSEYKVGMIPFYSYRYRLQGASRLHKQKKYEHTGISRTFAGIPFKDMVYEFGLKNIPSFKDENFISSREDYIKKIEFQLAEINYPSGYRRKYMDTWPNLANEYLEADRFGRYLKKSEKWAGKNANSFKTMDEEQRYNAILDFVKSNYKWNEYSGDFALLSFKDFQDELSGNIANINLLTIGIMRSNGIEANPVIISTRNNGKVQQQFPNSDAFNYVLILAKINDKLKLLDATQGFCPNQLIPSKCINGKGFIITEDSENWITISNNAPSIEETKLEYTINQDNYTIDGVCEKTSTGYLAIRDRRNYYNDNENFKTNLKKYGFNDDESFEVKYLMEEDQPFEYQFDFTQDIDIIDNQIILAPFAHLSPEDNPFKQEKREMPIDLVTKKAYRYNVIINIPKGYKVDVMPVNKTLKSENVEFNYMAQKIEENKIRLFAIYNFKKPNYPSKSYRELKNFMNTVTKKLNSKIVLIKDESISDVSENVSQ